MASPELIFLITGSLHLLTTFTYFSHSLPPSLATTNLSSVSMSSVFLGSTYKWDYHTVFVFLSGLFHLDHIIKVHSCCCILYNKFYINFWFRHFLKYTNYLRRAWRTAPSDYKREPSNDHIDQKLETDQQLRSPHALPCPQQQSLPSITNHNRKK